MHDAELDNYWKTVVDTIQDAVMIVDTGGTIVSVNKAFETVTGYGRDEVLGAPCSVLNCNSCAVVREQTGCHHCQMFAKGSLRRQQCVLRRRDGSHVHVVKNASVLKDISGNVTGAVETMTDISDLIAKETQIESFRRELRAEDRFHGMIGASAAMQKVFELITNAAQSDAPVIIYGESGTGKELVARAIHKSGPRSGQPYIKVNCAALNESLLESELFGHVKGAFTGALRSRSGRFAAAAGGDIFLDEIGDLPLSTQVKLLRVLEEKVIERVGDHRPLPVEVRIITATNRDLPHLIGEGLFREDFYYRLNVIPIWVPPLRERISDIPLLAEAFFRRILLKSGKQIEAIGNEALELLMRYRWPGNIRELKSAFEFAVVACSERVIGPHHLPPQISGPPLSPAAPEKAPQSLEEIKKERLLIALKQTGGNQSAAARELGISRTAVWQQIKRFGIDHCEYA